MASGTVTPPLTADRLFREGMLALDLWKALFVPVALAFTLGILADRFYVVPLGWSLLLAAGCVVAWAASLAGKKINLAVVYLWVGVAALARVIIISICESMPTMTSAISPPRRPARPGCAAPWRMSRPPSSASATTPCAASTLPTAPRQSSASLASKGRAVGSRCPAWSNSSPANRSTTSTSATRSRWWAGCRRPPGRPTPASWITPAISATSGSTPRSSWRRRRRR